MRQFGRVRRKARQNSPVEHVAKEMAHCLDSPLDVLAVRLLNSATPEQVTLAWS
jgi:hypothetical protein